MSIAKNLSKTEIEGIYSGANSAIWESHHLAAQSAMKTAREEDYVATLVTDGVHLIAKRWIQILDPKGIDLRVSGVFCHGHPQVEFGSGSRVELADLLIVHQHRSKAQSMAKAMLVQAKMSSDATHRLSANDAQLALFSTWPAFKFVTGKMTAGMRDIAEKGKGSRYALVLETPAYPERITWADQCPWAASKASQDLAAEHSFAKLLGNMLLGKDGRLVRLSAPKDDWSRTIKELLDTTGNKTYRRGNIKRDSTLRGTATSSSRAHTLFFSQSPAFTGGTTSRARRLATSEQFFQSALQNLDSSRDDAPPPDEQLSHEGGGMSVLIFETLLRD